MTGCTTHSERAAGWHCSLCATELCVDCAALTEHQVVVCASCGTLAQPHLAPRAEVFPFERVWPTALAELRTPAGIIQVVVAATAAHFAFTVGKALWVVGCLGTAAWVLNVARRKAIGIGPFGPPTWDDLRLVLTGPLPRFACAAGVIGLGAMGWTGLGLVARPLASPWPWLLALAALVVVPPALTIATIAGPGTTIVWPWRLGRWLRVLGKDLRPLQLAVLLVVGLELFEAQLPPINRELEDTRMLEHLFQSWVPRLLSFAALGALGALSGLLVVTRAGGLGHGRPEDDQVPRVTEAPAGRYVPPVRDLEAEQRELARKFAPISLDLSQPSSAIARGAREEALAAYRTGELRAERLELEPAVTLAQWLAGSGDVQGAADLLRVATSRLGGEEAALARALVVLARLCAERLGAQLEARRLYEEVARRFPGTPAARFAAEQLSAPVRPGSSG